MGAVLAPVVQGQKAHFLGTMLVNVHSLLLIQSVPWRGMSSVICFKEFSAAFAVFAVVFGEKTLCIRVRLGTGHGD